MFDPRDLDGQHYYGLVNSIRSTPKLWTWVYKPNKYGCGCALLVSYCDDTLRAESRFVSMCKEHYNVDAACSESSYSYGPNYNPYAEWSFEEQNV